MNSHVTNNVTFILDPMTDHVVSSYRGVILIIYPEDIDNALYCYGLISDDLLGSDVEYIMKRILICKYVNQMDLIS